MSIPMNRENRGTLVTSLPVSKKCPSCNKEMEWAKGVAIDTGDWDDRAIGHAPVYNDETLELCECLKCPLCGHSEDFNPLSCYGEGVEEGLMDILTEEILKENE